jgi:hypothetical protein
MEVSGDIEVPPGHDIRLDTVTVKRKFPIRDTFSRLPGVVRPGLTVRRRLHAFEDRIKRSRGKKKRNIKGEKNTKKYTMKTKSCPCLDKLTPFKLEDLQVQRNVIPCTS